MRIKRHALRRGSSVDDEERRERRAAWRDETRAVARRRADQSRRPAANADVRGDVARENFRRVRRFRRRHLLPPSQIRRNRRPSERRRNRTRAVGARATRLRRRRLSARVDRRA